MEENMGFFKNLFGGGKDEPDYIDEDMLERESWSKDQWQEFIVEEAFQNIIYLEDEDQKCNEFDKNELLNEIKSNKELAKKVLADDGWQLTHFNDDIKNDKELVILAVSPKNGGAPSYRYASDDLKKDPDVIAATKKGNLDDGMDEDEGIYV